MYEVREVEGPGKPGELYVHGERMNRRFFYAAPPPLATLRPTDIVGYDSYGLPVANRVVGYVYEPASAAVNPLMMGAARPEQCTEIMASYSVRQVRLWARRCFRTSRTQSMRAIR